MLWDTHMHCHFSGDSEASPESMIQEAIRRGLSGICFTDHLDYDYKEEPGLFDLDFEAYYQTIHALQAKYQKEIPILCGIEIGLQPHLVTENREITKLYPFDFVIGSSHVVHGIDPYYAQYYDNRLEQEAYMEYFESILENVTSGADYDVYGHLDYVVRYGPNKNKYYSHEKFADIIDEILRTLISRGKGLELNMAGFKYGLGHAHPVMDTLKRYKELGGEIITIGSDGHTPEQIAWEFEKAPAILKEAGFEYFTTYKNREPKFHKIL